MHGSVLWELSLQHLPTRVGAASAARGGSAQRGRTTAYLPPGCQATHCAQPTCPSGIRSLRARRQGWQSSLRRGSCAAPRQPRPAALGFEPWYCSIT